MLYLSLAFCTKFTNKGLSYMANGKGCHKIVHLDLSGCEQVRGLLTFIIILSFSLLSILSFVQYIISLLSILSFVQCIIKQVLDSVL